MKTEIGKFIAVVSMLGLLASCAQTGALEAANDNTRKAAQNARTYADHENLAKQYEHTAKELLVKAEEQKKLLRHYEDKSYLYGRQGLDFQSHTLALLRKYEQSAERTINQAAFHHNLASQLAQRDVAPERSNRENKARMGSDPKNPIENSAKAL